jgi:hypothetical protein
MFGDGDDAGHCANGLTAERFRESTVEERAIYRRWLRGVAACTGFRFACGRGLFEFGPHATDKSLGAVCCRIAASRLTLS